MAKAELKLGVDASEASALMQVIHSEFEKQNATIGDVKKDLEVGAVEIAAVNNRIAALELSVQAFERALEAFSNSLSSATAAMESFGVVMDDVRCTMNGVDSAEAVEDESDEQRASRIGLRGRVEELEHVLRGRNRSAPVKRNMTDEDARRVLVGDVKDMGHKEAGEAVGLTYAQVYSCRLEYTFKHVHKALRETGWKNTWSAKK